MMQNKKLFLTLSYIVPLKETDIFYLFNCNYVTGYIWQLLPFSVPTIVTKNDYGLWTIDKYSRMIALNKQARL